ncbi:MAG: hypothetical protein NXH72_09640 [Hyphomonadaceae bacterium]|nr:hypothetical protein [Hyphomonadaceae bacterium]
MMQSDEKYDDLTALFEAQDEALQNEAFVEQVMKPIYKRSRWRTPLLFGAGGLGLGAALSQMGGLLDLLTARALAVELQFEPVDMTLTQSILAEPLWAAAIAMVVLSCAAIIATERA